MLKKLPSFILLAAILQPVFAQDAVPVSPFPQAVQNFPRQQFVTSDTNAEITEPPAVVIPPNPATGLLSNSPSNQNSTAPPLPMPVPVAPRIEPIIVNTTVPPATTVLPQAVQNDVSTGLPAAPQPAPVPLPDLIPPLVTQEYSTAPELAPNPAPVMSITPDLAPNPAPQMTVPQDLAPNPAPGLTTPPNLAPPLAPDLVASPVPSLSNSLNGQTRYLAIQQSATPLAGGIIETPFNSCQQMAATACLQASNPENFQNCISSLKNYPSCAQFLAFATAANFSKGDDVDLIQYNRDSGITLLHVSRALGNYPGDYYAIGPNGNVMNLTSGPEVSRIDIQKNVVFPQIIQAFPNAQLWSYVDQPPRVEVLPTGGMRVILRFTLLNGCATCAKAGYAFISYDFANNGTLKSVQLLSLEAMPVVPV
jgi:hypothetical protein